MKKETMEALVWIVGILDKLEIKYQIGGGVAVALYGGGREVNDIDISISGSDFNRLVSEVKEYIVAGPKHYKNEKWDCNTLSLEYNGQDIDLTDADTLKMSSKEGDRWIENKHIYTKHQSVPVEVEGKEVKLMHPQVLIEYKSELGGEHQEEDIVFLKEYLAQNYK